MRNFPAIRYWRQALLAALWLTSAAAMSAEGDARFDVRSPSVMAIRKSLVDRFAILKEYFYAGAIGLTHDGLVAMRDPGAQVPEIRDRLEHLVVEENRDRSTLYREIARANGRPDWESQFQMVFAARWISRAPVGWYYRDSSGQWIRKLSAGANGVAPVNAASFEPFPGN